MAALQQDVAQLVVHGHPGGQQLLGDDDPLRLAVVDLQAQADVLQLFVFGLQAGEDTGLLRDVGGGELREGAARRLQAASCHTLPFSASGSSPAAARKRGRSVSSAPVSDRESWSITRLRKTTVPSASAKATPTGSRSIVSLRLSGVRWLSR